MLNVFFIDNPLNLCCNVKEGGGLIIVIGLSRFKFLPLIMGVYFAFSPILFEVCPITTSVSAKESGGRESFLEQRKDRPFWGWLYKKYVEDPEAFKEWVIMSSTVLIAGAVGGTGYGVYKYFNPIGLSCKGFSSFSTENSDEGPDFSGLSAECNNLLSDIKKEKTANDAYTRLYSCVDEDTQKMMDRMMTRTLCRYNEKMKGTGAVWKLFKERMSTSLQTFRDRICRFRVLISACDIPEDVQQKWLDELKDEKIYGKKLEEKDYEMACEFISE